MWKRRNKPTEEDLRITAELEETLADVEMQRKLDEAMVRIGGAHPDILNKYAELSLCDKSAPAQTGTPEDAETTLRNLQQLTMRAITADSLGPPYFQAEDGTIGYDLTAAVRRP